jgi:hypothetical protein
MNNDRDYPTVTVRQPNGDTSELTIGDLRNAAIDAKKIEINKAFWEVVEAYHIPPLQLSQICNAPIKILLHWSESGSAPAEALESLRRHIGETGIDAKKIETEHYSGWTIKSYQSAAGFKAETRTSSDKKPQQTFTAKIREEAVNQAKEWCSENIPF